VCVCVCVCGGVETHFMGQAAIQSPGNIKVQEGKVAFTFSFHGNEWTGGCCLCGIGSLSVCQDSVA
jgi:hypothetical protein